MAAFRAVARQPEKRFERMKFCFGTGVDLGPGGRRRLFGERRCSLGFCGRTPRRPITPSRRLSLPKPFCCRAAS